METTIIPKEEVIETTLAEHNVTEAVIAGLREKYLPLKINGLDDKEGYKAVHEGRIVCRDMRVLATKLCKAGREDAIAIQKAWIAKEKEVTGEIGKVEDYLAAQEEAIDREKERIKEEKARAELEKIRGRRDSLLALGMSFNGNSWSLGELKIDDVDVSAWADEAFELFMGKAQAEHEKEVARLAEIERLKKEEEEKHQAEMKRLAEAIREQERKEAAFKAEQEKARKEQEEREAELLRAQKAVEDEKRAIEEAKRREEEEKQRAAELEEAKAKAAHRARIEAEEKAKREEAERIEAERVAKIEAERQAALRPDKEKIVEYADVLSRQEPPAVKSPEAAKLLKKAYDTINAVADTLRKNSNEL